MRTVIAGMVAFVLGAGMVAFSLGAAVAAPSSVQRRHVANGLDLVVVKECVGLDELTVHRIAAARKGAKEYADYIAWFRDHVLAEGAAGCPQGTVAVTYGQYVNSWTGGGPAQISEGSTVGAGGGGFGNGCACGGSNNAPGASGYDRGAEAFGARVDVLGQAAGRYAASGNAGVNAAAFSLMGGIFGVAGWTGARSIAVGAAAASGVLGAIGGYINGQYGNAGNGDGADRGKGGHDNDR